MIDIHTHILFGVDDGCKTIEDSIRVLKSAEEQGVTDVFLTPHCSQRRGYDLTEEILGKKFHELQEKILEEEIKVNIHLAMEIDEESYLFQRLTNGFYKPLGDTNFILVDFGFSDEDIDEVIYELIVLGFKPIIAHPERYKEKNLLNIVKWKNTGALIQLDSESLFDDKKTKKFFTEIIKNKLADFIASDTHGRSDSYSNLKKVYEFIVKKTDKTYGDNIFNNNAKKLLLKKA